MIISPNLSWKPVLKINDREINPAWLVSLFGIEIDSKLNFEKQKFSNFWVIVSKQLNGICRRQMCMYQKGKERIINSLEYFSFNYGSLLRHFPKKSLGKIEKIQETCLRNIFNDLS